MRTFELPFTGVTAPGTNPFVQLATPATAAVQIISIRLGQTGYATGGTERVTGSVRSTATTMTTAQAPVTLDDLTGVASLLVSGTTANAYTFSSGGGTVVRTLTFEPFHNLQGMLFLPIPDEMPIIGLSRFFTLQFAAAPAGGTWNGIIRFKEL
jgi:hypothetical protein